MNNLIVSNIIDGKKISKSIREELKHKVEALKNKNQIVPKLAVIVVGDDPASRIYVNNKKKACAEIGIISKEYSLPKETSQNELISLIDKLNNNNDTNGILVQLPLPKHINEKEIIESINPLKDVDAFHELNVGKIMTNNFSFLPCTPAGIMELLNKSNINVSGKHCVVVGRSNIVGKPMAMLLLHKDATVTICHSKTKDLAKFTKMADILIVAVGHANFIKREMVKPGAVVIDVGMNRTEDGKLCGDVNFEDIEKIASYITPVPGGVGPMTIALLMKNTITATLIQNNLE